MTRQAKRDWLESLSEEDRAFVKRFILASGSLKGLADVYGISYPTVRLRLDRVIQKIKILDSQSEMSAIERTLRVLYVEGKLDDRTLNTILRAHRSEGRGTDEEETE